MKDIKYIRESILRTRLCELEKNRDEYIELIGRTDNEKEKDRFLSLAAEVQCKIVTVMTMLESIRYQY